MKRIWFTKSWDTDKELVKGQDQSKMLQKQLFDIKFTAKQLERESKKAEKRQAEHMAKLKTAIEKQDMERAKTCAENAMREKQQSLSLLKLASRMDGVAQRIQQALTMGNISKVSVPESKHCKKTAHK